jgi:hypothetical protein
MLKPPGYIQESGLLEAPPEFSWKGKGQHFGPSEGTKVHAELKKLATCGIVTLTALTAEWLMYRLRASIDLERSLHYVDATLAWELDRRYRNEIPLQDGKPSNKPAHQALADAVWLLRFVADDDYHVKRPDSNVNHAASVVNITKHVLPTRPKKAFTEWFQWAAARAAKLDPLPKGKKPVYTQFADNEEFYKAVRHYFGNPLPREALDPQSGFAPEERRARLSALLGRLDYRKNPFLRSPQEMQKLGFVGTPYELE